MRNHSRIALAFLALAIGSFPFSVSGFQQEPVKQAPALNTRKPQTAKQTLEYNQDIRPILAENCFACHGPDSASRKAGLRLDLRTEAIKAEAFVPGQPEKSELIKRVFADHSGKIMPPRKSHKKLTPIQKNTLKRWIAEGAEYQLHWSFLPPKRPAFPEVKNKTWGRNAIDRFILAEL